VVELILKALDSITYEHGVLLKEINDQSIFIGKNSNAIFINWDSPAISKEIKNGDEKEIRMQQILIWEMITESMKINREV
jgi:hypothetical protein